MKPTSSSRSANALVLATIALVVCSSLAVTMIDRTTSALTMQSARERSDRVHFTAASAANWASQWCLDNVASLPTFTGTNTTLQVPTLLSYGLTSTANLPNNTTPAITLTGLRANADGSRLYKLSCTVTSGTAGDRGYATNTNEVLIKYVPAPPASSTVSGLFTRALFSKLGFSIQGSPNIDAWNGTTGSYVAGSKKVAGNAINNYGSALVGSNGTVTTQGNAWKINSNPQIQNNAGLSAPDYTWSAPTSFTNQPAGANTSSAWTGSITLQAGNTYYAPGGVNGATITINVPNTITLQANAVCTIYLGGEFCTSNPIAFTGTNAGWGRVVMFQKDLTSTITDTSWDGNVSAGVLGDPSRFVFVTEYGKGKAGNITMNGTAAFGCILYAPYASVHLNGTFDFYGSLTVGTISELNGSFGLHFDTRLSGVNLTLPSATSGVATASVLGWRER